jgi:hypothetical protein
MVERVIQDRWSHGGAQVFERRLDTLRSRADFLAKRINHSTQQSNDRDKSEYAALMWAISELAGIGDEVRRRNMEWAEKKLEVRRNATKRAEQAEALNAQYRATNAALKAENHRLRMLLPRETQTAVGG